jgi:hypothetical protein
MKAPEATPIQPLSAAKASEKVGAPGPGRVLQERLWQLLVAPSAAALGSAAELLPLPSGAASLAAASGVDTASAGPSTDPETDRSLQSSGSQAELAATAYMLAGLVLRLSLGHDTSALAAALAESGDAAASGAANPPEIALQTLDQAGTGRASVELTHPELGTIGLEIELVHGAIRVTATADTESSAQVLQQGQAALAARLLRQGVALEALDVIVVRKRQRKPANRSRTRQRPEPGKEENQE